MAIAIQVIRTLTALQLTTVHIPKPKDFFANKWVADLIYFNCN